MKQTGLVFGFFLAIVFFGGSTTQWHPVTAAECRDQYGSRRTLKVVLYPFVPDRIGLFYDIKRDFEEKHDDIKVDIIDLTENYYDESKPKAVTNTDAAVYELDSVFLADFVKSNLIQPLPDSLVPVPLKFLPVAEKASQIEGRWYGLPHWVCTNFLFFKLGDRIGDVKTLSGLEDTLKGRCGSDNGLLMDAKGKSTLGELYLNALIDNYGDLAKAEPYLSVDSISTESTVAMKRAIALCDGDYCRDDGYHSIDGFYAKQFARRRGRALVGYSERMYYLISENMNSCKKGECLKPNEIDLKPLSLSDKGTHPFAWVDQLTVSSRCSGRCLEDAVAFIGFVTAKEEVLKALRPSRYDEGPRYLLPAIAELYSNEDLLNVAPLYEKMLSVLDGAIPVTGSSLNKRLREIGKKLDEDLLMR